MRRLVATHFRDLHELAIDVVGVDPFQHLGDGTAFVQPAIFCASLATSRLLDAQPDYYAGHSLGEIAALVAAGGLSVLDGMRLVTVRGRLMHQASLSRPGSMLAVQMNLAAASELASSLGLTVANDNSPDQVVLSGAHDAIDQARETCLRSGARSFKLPITGAFHTPAMHVIAPAFRATLEDIEISEPCRPVMSGVTAAPFTDIRDELTRSLTSGVRWREVVINLADCGVDRFLETGPGRALTRLADRTLGSRELQGGTMAASHA
jgi:acyl transferase domain-containing protein